jgi:electron transfer flavoprotein alpha subunit
MPEHILFLAHTEPDGTLSKNTLEAMAAAVSLRDGMAGATLDAGVVGVDVNAAAQAIAGVGFGRMLGASGEAFGQARYATDAAAAEALCRAAGATVVIAPATSRWNRALPGVAHRLGGRVDSHVTSVESGADGTSVGRWFYRQRMEARLRRTHRPWMLLVESGIAPAWTGAQGDATLEAVSVPIETTSIRTETVGYEAPPADQQTIRPDAHLLFVAGAGWTKKQADGQPHVADAEQLILGFLKGTKASLGGSKSLVDLSGEGQAVLPFMSHLNQVGQTGSTPRHPKGLATCCHGEEPHVVGWRFITERRAVNLDPNCGWARGKADVVYVADAFAVMKRVNELLG